MAEAHANNQDVAVQHWPSFNCVCSTRKIFVLFCVDVFGGPSCISSGHVEAAITSYKQALLLRPDFPEATCNLLHTLQVFLFRGFV